MVAIAQHPADNAAEQAVVAARASHAPTQRFVWVALEQAIEDARKPPAGVQDQIHDSAWFYRRMAARYRPFASRANSERRRSREEGVDLLFGKSEIGKPGLHHRIGMDKSSAICVSDLHCLVLRAYPSFHSVKKPSR